MVLLEELNKKEIDKNTEWEKVGDTIVFNGKIKINKYDFEQRVQIVCALTHVRVIDVAHKCGTSKIKLLNRCKTARFKFCEQQALADAMGVKSINKLVSIDGRREFFGKDTREMLLSAMDYDGKNQTDLANIMGKTRAAISDKLLNDSFSREEIEEFAGAVNCKYENYFELSDGTRI